MFLDAGERVSEEGGPVEIGRGEGKEEILAAAAEQGKSFIGDFEVLGGGEIFRR